MSVTSRSRRLTSCLQDAQQPGPGGRVVDQVQGLDRRADRGQRVLDLVGDVGGEALDGVHPLGHRRRSSPPGPATRSPSSSLRWEMSGSEMARRPSSRTRSAAPAMPQHRLGDQAVEQDSDETRVVAIAIRMKGSRAFRSAAMIWSTSPASRVSTPSTALDVLDRDRHRHHLLAASRRCGACRPPAAAAAWPGDLGGQGARAAPRRALGLASAVLRSRQAERPLLAGLAGRRQGLGLDPVGDRRSCRRSRWPWASNSRARAARWDEQASAGCSLAWLGSQARLGIADAWPAGR